MYSWETKRKVPIKMKETITFALMIRHFPRKKGLFRSIAFAIMQC